MFELQRTVTPQALSDRFMASHSTALAEHFMHRSVRPISVVPHVPALVLSLFLFPNHGALLFSPIVMRTMARHKSEDTRTSVAAAAICICSPRQKYSLFHSRNSRTNTCRSVRAVKGAFSVLKTRHGFEPHHLEVTRLRKLRGRHAQYQNYTSSDFSS